MSRCARIHQWLVDNPGWHFAGDVSEGLSAAGDERYAVSHALGVMSSRGLLAVSGAKHGSKRYRLARDARKYTQKASA